MNHSNNGHSQAGSWVHMQFSKFAQLVSGWTGHPAAFLLALAVVVVWVITGPIFNYSDTWQLVINTGTTIVTFLMVFLIQNTQNREILSVQLKLSELVLAMKGAEDKFAAIEDLSDEELEDLHNQCRARAEVTLNRLQGRRAKKGASASADADKDTPKDTSKPRAMAQRAKTQKKTSRARATS